MDVAYGVVSEFGVWCPMNDDASLEPADKAILITQKLVLSEQQTQDAAAAVHRHTIQCPKGKEREPSR